VTAKTICLAKVTRSLEGLSVGDAFGEQFFGHSPYEALATQLPARVWRWCAACHFNNYEEALWITVKGLGDRDSICAIVGGIVALSAPEIPAPWLERREPLPE